MLVQITQYRELAEDANGNLLPIGKTRLAVESRSSDGEFAEILPESRFIRVATDTAVQIDMAGGVTDAASEFLPAGSVEFFEARPGAALTVASA